MGAFYLARTDNRSGTQRALRVFEKRGLPLAKKATIGANTLHIFGKKWIDHRNYVELSDLGPSHAACIGTLVYKKELGAEATGHLARDLILGKVDPERLLGDYVFFMWKDSELKILQGENDLLHLYANRDRTVLSSSFLAVAVAREGKNGIDERAVLQTLLTGCVFGSTTLLRGVERVIDLPAVDEAMGVSAIAVAGTVPPRFDSFAQAVDGIEAELDRYFAEIDNVLMACSASIGLSGGYDSRLLLGCLAWRGCPVVPHTHYRRVEDSDARIARALAAEIGAQLLTVEVAAAGEMAQERLRQNLEENYWTCDGNVRVNLGWLSEYRRDAYRQRIAGQARLGLNGIGGELFRNLGHFVRSYKRLDDWIRESVLEPNSWWHLERGAREGVVAQLAADVGAALGWGKTKSRVSRLDNRYFYSRGWVVGGPSLRNNIENPCWYFLSPFCERRIANAALAATDFIGVDGELEAKLLRRCHPGLAGIESNYGHDFSTERRQDLARAWVSGMLPAPARAFSRRVRLERSLRNPASHHTAVIKACRQELLALKDLGLPIRWDAVERDDWALNRAVALGYFLRKHG